MKQYIDYINKLINEYILESYRYLWAQDRDSEKIN